MAVQAAVPFIVSLLDDALRRPPAEGLPEPSEQPATPGLYEPPDPLGFIGGSENFWQNVNPRNLWNAGAKLGIDLSTPGTDQRAEAKAETAEAESRRAAISEARLIDFTERAQESAAERKTDGEPPRKERIQPLTDEQWLAMTPAQQNAVMFNTNLVNAVRADKRGQGEFDPTKTERRAYNDTLRDVFGTTFSEEPRGIDYAPNTVALLKELDTLPEQELGTLDDYLRLDTAITAKQVDKIEKPLQPNFPDHLVPQNELTPAQERLSLAQNLTRAQGEITERLAETLERGQKLLADSTELLLEQTAAEFGVANKPKPLPQLNELETTAANDYLSYFAAPQNDIARGLADIPIDMAARGLDPGAQRRIYDMMLEVTRTAMEGGDWFDEEAAQWGGVRNPQAVAQALGAALQKVG
jgi:hypothetical protein